MFKLLSIVLFATSRFHIGECFVCTAPTKPSLRCNMAIESFLLPGFMDASIALVSAAAGVASQLPRIQELEKELDIAKSALTKSELELVGKISELEEKLFRMDEAFEGETSKIKKKFDDRMVEELKKVAERAKVDYKFSLDIKLAEQKQSLLSEKLDFVSSLNGDKAVELVNLRLRQEQIQSANKKLEDALLKSQVEIEKLSELTRKKNGWWPF